MSIYYIGIDTETSGLDPDKHGICEIGAVATDSTGKVVDFFQSYCCPTTVTPATQSGYFNLSTAELDPKALEVNGLTADFILNQTPDIFAMNNLVGWLNGFTSKADSTTGQDEVRKVFCNAPFDLGFLNKLARRAGVFSGFEQNSYRVIDIWSIAHAVLPGAPMNSLTKICAALKVENRKAHSAVADALATVNCYHELMKRRKNFIDPEEVKAQWHSAMKGPGVINLPSIHVDPGAFHV